MKTNDFSKFSWEPCEIFHNTAYVYTRRCIIGIPVYKSKLEETEKASLNQLCKIIGHSYEICLICPDNIELNEYIDIAYSNGVYLSYLFCGNDYFKSTETYSYMLETPDFYKCFNDYEYLMIYQLDGWIFTNFLDYYINLNVDYIGSPWISYILNFGEDTVGNGGVSLRKVQKFIDVCSKLTKDDYLKQHVENEDLFFCKTMRKQINLKFADIKNASNFSLQSDWNYFIKKYNNNHLPMCLHAWNRDYRVLKKYIEIKYDNSKHLTNDIITYDNLINYQKFRNLDFVNRKEKKVEKPNSIKETIKVKGNYKQFFEQNTLSANFFSWSAYFNKSKTQKIEQTKKQHINILIVHYNTPYLTECLIKSINKFVGDNCTIYIFDNSDKEPFTYRQNNIKIFDNTKGQIIDFEKWLEQFPRKDKSSAWKNNYGSAKHSKTIQKCIELIDENFILLDSDILLKKDIHELYDKNFTIIGDAESWKPARPYENQQISSRIRLKPYICFINVNNCKKKNIKYHDDNCIYGLTKNGDNYDTGAYIYEECINFKEPFKNINCNDYIVHYKGGSWVEQARKFDNYKQISQDDWLEKNKQYWKIKKVIYTCITGNYEKIVDPTYVQNDFDYICFTDNMNQISKIWKFKPIPGELKKLSKVKQQRIIKICPHLYLPEYDESIWVDGSIDILDNMDDFIQEHCNIQNKSVFIRKHPQRDCIYDEGNECIRIHKDKFEIINQQLEKYKYENYPENNGLVETNIIYRIHNDEYCKQLMELWKKELLNGSHRDQLSFNYCLWKIGIKGFQYLDPSLLNSKYFEWHKYHNRK